MVVLSIFIAEIPVGDISNVFGYLMKHFHMTKFCSMTDRALSLGIICRNLYCLLRRYAKVQGFEYLTLI